jgi:acetolactate synthase-1/3 small subunit
MNNHRYTITALVENRPGVLNRVVSIFRRPGINLDSLTVGRTERPEVSRMTMVLEGTRRDADYVERELRKLIHVIRVEDVNGTPHVTRDMALIKVKTTQTTRPEVMQMCSHFPARIVDVAMKSILIEVVGEEAEIEGIVELLRPFGIIEMVRAGVVAMGRADNVLDTHCERSSWAERQFALSKAS